MNTIATEKKTGLYWLWLSVVIMIIDQLSKYLVVHSMNYDTPIYLAPFFANLTLVHNKGASFGFLSEWGSLAIALFIVTACVVSVVLCVWLHRLPSKSYWLGIA